MAAEAVTEAATEAVTVAVVLYNGRAHLPHCLQAVTGLAGAVAEVLVVDNASTDGGPDWLRAHHPEVRLIQTGENRGPSAARNRALAESRTDRVLLLDCDTAPEPDCLVRLIAALDHDPAAAIVQPRAVFDDDPGRIHYDGASFTYTGLLTLRNFGARVETADAARTEVDAVISMALLVDRERLAALGIRDAVFDDLYFIYFEDTDLSYRVRAAGGRLAVEPAAVVRHRHGTAGVSYRAGQRIAYRRAFYLSRNRWIFMLKHFAWRTLLVTMPAQLAYDLVLFAFLAVEGQPHGWFAGKLDLVRHLGALRARRRAARATRTVADRELLRFDGFSFIPLLTGGRVARAVGRLLDVVFGAYWNAVRWLL